MQLITLQLIFSFLIFLLFLRLFDKRMKTGYRTGAKSPSRLQIHLQVAAMRSLCALRAKCSRSRTATAAGIEEINEDNSRRSHCRR